MKIDILTLFPEMFRGPFNESIIKRAQKKNLVEIKIHNLRIWADDKRRTVDDRPFGGGTGMVLMIKPINKALKELKTEKTKVIFLGPKGKVFNQKKAEKLAKIKHLIFICGHYEDIDERIREHLIDEEISIGDYILTGGELPTMVVIDTIVRLLPGVLEKSATTKEESFGQSSLLEYPQYTRPANFQGWQVPEVLLSGDHKKIQKWRDKKALEKTIKYRPDLIR